ncbi:hypothetical protein VPH35_113295 [Triticum aestivum]
MFIQYLFWEKVQPLDDEAFDPLAHEYPLMLNWSKDEAKKHGAYDTSFGRGNGTIDDVISEKYMQTLIAQQGRKAEEELEQEDRAQKKKDNRDQASLSRDTTLDQVVKCIKDMQKEIRLLPEKCAEIVVEKLEKKGLVFKPNKGSDDDIEFVEHSEDWVGKYGLSKYKSSKYWTDVKSTPAKEDIDDMVDASFTTGKGKKMARKKGVHHNTPGTGDEGDPFVIEDNGNSPNPSLATVGTNDFPGITSTPKNMNEVSDESSADKSEEISMDSLNTRIKNAKENGTEENDGKRKRNSQNTVFHPTSRTVDVNVQRKRAEIAKDTKEVNALIGAEHPDISSWPIREYDTPLQKDGVSCGLFVVKCVQNWDGDDWTFDFDQDEVNASRGRILAEILFSECNTKEVVKEKILKIMERK